MLMRSRKLQKLVVARQLASPPVKKKAALLA
jgi:hypothetical protein